MQPLPLVVQFFENPWHNSWVAYDLGAYEHSLLKQEPSIQMQGVPSDAVVHDG